MSSRTARRFPRSETARALIPPVLPLCILLIVLLATVSCHDAADRNASQTAGRNTIDLNQPVPEPEPQGPDFADFANMTTEELWASRCGQCHDKELGLDKYKGREWYPIVGRMMKKPRSYINATIARELYIYLYRQTTGEDPPDIEEYEDAPVSSAGETFGED